VYGEFSGHCLSCSRGRIEYRLTFRSDWNGWEKLVAARGWDLPGVRQTTVCRLKHTAAQMWTHPPGISRYVALTSSEECVNPLLIHSCCYHPPGRGRIQQLSVAMMTDLWIPVPCSTESHIPCTCCTLNTFRHLASFSTSSSS